MFLNNFKLKEFRCWLFHLFTRRVSVEVILEVNGFGKHHAMFWDEQEGAQGGVWQSEGHKYNSTKKKKSSKARAMYNIKIKIK